MERPRGSCVRGTIRGSVIRNSRFEDGQRYILSMEIAIVFLGGVALNLIAYSWFSPYWYMMGSRAYTVTPELRVLGLTSMLEGNEAIGSGWLWDAKKTRTSYGLSERRDRVCSEDFEWTASEKGESTCDLDCQDMQLLGGLRVLCDANGNQMPPQPIPIFPAQRVLAHFNETLAKSDPNREVDLILRWGCDRQHKPGLFTRIKCPVGYKRCKKEVEHRCRYKKETWTEPACCVNPKTVGKPLFGVTKTPTYVQVFGWAQWRAQELRDEERTSSTSQFWCSVRQFRCATLTEFANNGRWCYLWVSGAALLLIAALALAMSRFKHKAVSAVAFLFALAGLANLYAHWSYYNSTVQTLEWTTTPVDEWGRPYVHSMDQYDHNGRTIESMPEDDPTIAEWMYYHVNARVDYLTSDPRNKQGFTQLWAAYLGIAGGFVALAASFVSLEMQFTLRGHYPVASMLSFVIKVLLFIPSKIKKFIDDNLAAYPVLFVYPWQRLYPKAFTCGQVMYFPFDQIWDLVLMLPVHCTRAIWDYVSCQDITSPHEKKVLQEKGIYNDRLCSLLCSRRSYFAMMAFLGATSFVVNLTGVVNISMFQAGLRQAAELPDRYPYFITNLPGGDEALEGQSSIFFLGRYSGAMVIRLYATIMEGVNDVDTGKALIEWLGGFIAISCAWGALSHWTDFASSRKFCLIGWIFMMLTPVMTSSFSVNRNVDWDKVRGQMVNVSAEVWEEIMWIAQKTPCDELQDYLHQAIDNGDYGCSWVMALKFFMPKVAVRACKDFKKYRTQYEKQLTDNVTDSCARIKNFSTYAAEMRLDCERTVEKVAPDVINLLQMYTGIEAGIKNKLKLMTAVMGMAPALMQGGLMIKNMLPRQTLPSILTTLPFAFTTLVWAQYQLIYQVLGGTLLLVACLAISFGPLVYYFYAKYYRIVQPMCDQQSVTLTFRIWWYAAICALITPYALLIVYILWVNDFEPDLVYQMTLGWLSVSEVLKLVTQVLSSYAYSLQAGIDWFVDEIVQHHTTLNTPAVLTATISPEEAASLQQILGADLDLDSIDKGTYVCGGLGDPVRLEPSEEGTWNQKARIYAVSLAYKDCATLDAFAGHLKGDPELPRILARARRPWYRLLNNPPHGAFNGREVIGAARFAEAEGEQPAEAPTNEQAQERLTGEATGGAGS